MTLGVFEKFCTFSNLWNLGRGATRQQQMLAAPPHPSISQPVTVCIQVTNSLVCNTHGFAFCLLASFDHES